MAIEEDNDEEPEVIVVEFKVSMHCNACERLVAKIISKIEGVETFKTDVNRHIVEVTGTMDPKKVLKKLKKKTGKRVEMLEIEKEDDDDDDATKDESFNVDAERKSKFGYYNHCCVDDDTLMMFSDENPNACRMM